MNIFLELKETTTLYIKEAKISNHFHLNIMPGLDINIINQIFLMSDPVIQSLDCSSFNLA